MQMCEAELASVTGEARKKQITDCLRRRLEGEKIVERDCKRQMREVAVDLAGASKLELQRQCVSRALQVSYSELPRRPPPAPKPEGSPALVATDGTDTPMPAVAVQTSAPANNPAATTAVDPAPTQ